MKANNRPGIKLMTVLLILLILAGLGAFGYLFADKKPADEEQTAQTSGTVTPTPTPPSLSQLYEEELERLEEETAEPTGQPLQLPWTAPSSEEESEEESAASSVPASTEEPEEEAPAEEPEEEAEEEPEVDLYYYRSLLNDEEKEVYDQIYAGISERSDVFEINAVEDYDRLSQISHYVFCDHPELFWFKGAYHFSGNSEHYNIEYEYSLTAEEIASRQEEIRAVTEEFLSTVDENLSDYDKIKAVYDYLSYNTVYLNSPDDQNIYSALVSHETVCEGYSRATEYLLQQMGIPCILVEGMAGGETHAWNAVYCDHEWYNIDVTYGDIDIGMNGYDASAPEELEVNYAFFMMDDQECYIKQGRTPDEKYFTGVLPACTDPSLLYYPSHGLYFESTEDAWNAVEEGLKRGERIFRCQFANAGLVDSFKEDFSNGRYSQMAYDIMGHNSSTSYGSSPEACTLELWLNE
ncbi:MAG: hypothetical protein E7240_01550 [Lachnospiraceae bacterium]|nr:hypothetical protein [Lachnospiraceae bacterium]